MLVVSTLPYKYRIKSYAPLQPRAVAVHSVYSLSVITAWGLEAVAETEEERSVLAAELIRSFLEVVDHAEVGA